ncbi:hypothetical protein C4578_03140 [Candidatus Microgenomates bacterium]|jgi:excinuclease ABC subunit C|nr:MAG: hypothetical protein C4578_03140 [Candidatus Microgenomates bacterium]
MLKEKLKSLPKKPGVYILKNDKGKIIYIGKALVLKNRVSSYFQKSSKDPKTKELVSNIADLQYFAVNSEFEALLLEARLIKQHKPKFNTVQKDSKSYLYIVIGKDFPNRVYLARWTELNSQNMLDWFGPFPSSSDARRILKTLRPIFPYRSCKNLHKAPCLYYQLGLCPGVCIGKNEGEYKETIKALRKVLSGKTNMLDKIIKSLEKEMKKESRNLKFEEAQGLKNKVDSLKRLKEGWRIPKEKREMGKVFLELRKLLTKYQGTDPITLKKIEGYDVSNLGRDIIVGSMVTFIEGEPDKSLYRKFNLKYNLSGQNDPEGIKQVVRRRLNHPEWIYPQLILVDGGKTQISAAFEAIKEKDLEDQIALLGIAKKEEIVIVPKFLNGKVVSWKSLRLSRRHPELQLLQAIRDESHRFAQKYYKEKHSQALKS